MITDLDVATVRWCNARNRLGRARNNLRDNPGRPFAALSVRDAKEDFEAACDARAKIRNQPIVIDWNG